MKKLYRKSSFLLAVTGLLLISQLWAGAQSPAQPPHADPATPATPHSSQPEQDKGTAVPDTGKQEQKISPKEAEELFRDVDQIMQFASKETGLPIKKEVKRRLVTRDEVVAYLQKNMAEDKDAQRLQRSRAEHKPAQKMQVFFVQLFQPRRQRRLHKLKVHLKFIEVNKIDLHLNKIKPVGLNLRSSPAHSSQRAFQIGRLQIHQQTHLLRSRLSLPLPTLCHPEQP